jgi:hypothetical protein
MTQIWEQLASAQSSRQPLSVILALMLALAACSSAGQRASHSTEGFGSSTPPSDHYPVAPRVPADQMGKF